MGRGQGPVFESQDHVVRGRRQLPPVAEVSTTDSTDSVTTTTDTGNGEDVNFMKSAASIKRRLVASKKICGPTDGRGQNKKGKAA